MLKHITVKKKLSVFIVILLVVSFATGSYFSYDQGYAHGYIQGLAEAGGTPTISPDGIYDMPWVNGTAANFEEFYLNSEDKTDLLAYPEQAASYIIFKEGSTTKAKNMSTGKIDYSGTDSVTVIQSTLASLTNGRTWKEIVVFNGNFSLSSRIRPFGYTILDLRNCRLTLEDGVNENIIDPMGSQTDIEIWGGILDGNKAGQTEASHGISANSKHMIILNTYISDTYSDGIYIRYAENDIKIIGGTFINNGRHGISAREIKQLKIIHSMIINPNNQGIDVEPSAIEVCDDILIDGVTIDQTSSGSWGISIGSAAGGDITNVRIVNCNLNGTTYDGIYIANTVGARVINNMVEGYTRNIWLESGSDIKIRSNVGYITERSGTSEVSNDDWVSHGLAGEPDIVLLSIEETDANYFLQLKATNTTHFQIYLYDHTAGVTESVDKTVNWYAFYEP